MVPQFSGFDLVHVAYRLKANVFNILLKILFYLLQKRVLVMNITVNYQPIEKTPFILALILPTQYGHTQVTYTRELTHPLSDDKYSDDHCKEVGIVC